MKRKLLITLCLLLTLFVGSVVAQRVRKHGGLVDITSAGPVVISSRSGQAITLTGATAHVGASTFSSTVGIAGKATFTADPANTTNTNASVVVNPATIASNEFLLSVLNNGSNRFTVDAEGDTTTAGNASITGTLTVGGNALVVPKKYVALLSQSGTSAPVATVLENSLGGTVVWSRAGEGEYKATLAGAFPAGKTVLLAQPGGDYNLIDAGFINYFYWLSANELEIVVRNNEAANSDGELKSAAVEIRVYP